MPTIVQCLRAIRQAVYGRDVREAIAEGIENCYSDVSNGVTLAHNAAQAIAQSAQDSINSAVDNATSLAIQAANAANTAAESAAASATAASSSVALAQQHTIGFEDDGTGLILKQIEEA